MSGRRQDPWFLDQAVTYGVATTPKDEDLPVDWLIPALPDLFPPGKVETRTRLPSVVEAAPDDALAEMCRKRGAKAWEEGDEALAKVLREAWQRLSGKTFPA